MRVGIDVRNAAVAALEMQAIGRDHSLQPMRRRACGARARRVRRIDEHACNAGLEARGLAIAGEEIDALFLVAAPTCAAAHFFEDFSLLVLSKKRESKRPSTLGALSTTPSVT